MQLNYFLASFSFILIQFTTNAFPMTNEEGISYNPQLFKRSHSSHLVKRKKHHRLDDYYFGKYHGHHHKHDRSDYPFYQESGFKKHDNYFNPRYSSVYPEGLYGQPIANPYMNSYPMSYASPIGSIGSVSNSAADPNSMNSGTPAGLLPNPVPAADPATVQPAAAAPIFSTDSSITNSETVPPSS